MHYVRAVTFKENARRTRTEAAPAVLGVRGGADTWDSKARPATS